MKKAALLSITLLGLTACSQGVTTMTDRSQSPCGDKPNCVSTQDTRKEYNLTPFTLTESTNIDAIEQVALELPGAKTAVKEDNYLRIECTSKIMRFVDDLELKIEGDQLIVRSESRVGYSDFGVNRKRAEQLRSLLANAELIK
ncbi:DUF1499 domain-containing protein [Vibrio campbellii]|uniref:DUF1499 domain-containing protein n=1 Tax=Vibrio campbellii (strain ATCC BAA-1116) TaxID=2902295 RepID=A7MXP5_VIBC1|nr:DUF1499 domain-containing protein [Vibrio campbellii]ABU69923.1 hypothetical protein VIBHAR_00924 [Vibrio campbellii ATCC BAA-1116]AGU94623.1 hypothetical protein M892_08280 [Vibrio campbellii ATCC BAA-1116]MBT0120123.1 DUF1499 domain-containing protein [Vibrio campbellii]MBT0135034.1 DUF1499 domain-containing protein [Vibrio campbellii]MBT0139777.1 DUF1499 domain-containing protein [Vibrio campbellii]